jgi:hypothetical protein
MILERLEQLPVGSFQYKLLVVTGLGWLFDSMDTGLISFILPVLAKERNLSPAQVGWIGSIGLIGMALGAVLAGTLADRIGRKKVFSITVLLYSLSTGMCALSWSYESLLFFRFLVGFGLGGELPVAATLMSEYAPAHLRGRFIVLLESFWGLGWLVAASATRFPSRFQTIAPTAGLGSVEPRAPLARSNASPIRSLSSMGNKGTRPGSFGVLLFNTCKSHPPRCSRRSQTTPASSKGSATSTRSCRADREVFRSAST